MRNVETTSVKKTELQPYLNKLQLCATNFCSKYILGEMLCHSYIHSQRFKIIPTKVVVMSKWRQLETIVQPNQNEQNLRFDFSPSRHFQFGLNIIIVVVVWYVDFLLCSYI